MMGTTPVIMYHNVILFTVMMMLKPWCHREPTNLLLLVARLWGWMGQGSNWLDSAVSAQRKGGAPRHALAEWLIPWFAIILL